MGGWTFNSDASAYTATVTVSLAFMQGGITVNGGSIAMLNDGGFIGFANGATAGAASFTTQSSGATVFGMSAGTDTATAGSASFLNVKGGTTAFQAMTNAGTATFANRFGGQTVFVDSSSAANATITNSKGGLTLFLGSAMGASAAITNSFGGTVIFAESSNAGNATITNASFGGPFVGIPVGIAFLEGSAAGTATIVNNNGLTAFGSPGGPDTATADHAQITNNVGGGTQFNAFATAGFATITINSGGAVAFFDNSTGGLAQFITNGTGTVDFGSSLGPNSDGQISAGSIAGSGTYYIGSGNRLTVGGNGLSTEVSGVIADTTPCGCSPPGPGALAKTGSGTLTLSGINTYSGGTTFAGGQRHDAQALERLYLDACADGRWRSDARRRFRQRQHARRRDLRRRLAGRYREDGRGHADHDRGQWLYGHDDHRERHLCAIRRGQRRGVSGRHR